MCDSGGAIGAVLEDQSTERIEIERLLQSGRYMEHPRLPRGIAPAAQYHHGYASEPSVLDLLGPEAPAIHPRHLQIEQYDAGHDDTQETECLLPIGRGGNLEAVHLEHGRHGLANERVILDDQDGATRGHASCCEAHATPHRPRCGWSPSRRTSRTGGRLPG